jgi:serine phosphatase RsbU (regulator of sigma subunit)
VSAARANILVVDDIEDNRNILIRRMRRLGVEGCAEAADGVAALEHIRANPVDLVLLDVMMPRMGGVEVLETLKQEGRLEDTSVIMISAASEIETVVRCLELGADDYLPKPFDPAILRARVGSVLEKKFLRAEVRAQLKRLEAELAHARRQQLAMVPTDFRALEGRLDIHAIMRPAYEVGGDLYDFFFLTPDVVCLAIGDVSGKGMPAALFMARTRSLLRAGALQFQSIAGRPPLPSELATLLNEELCKNNDDCMFMTLIAGFLDLASGCFSYVNAGHLPPLLLRASGAREVDSTVDPPLGVADDVVYRDNVIQLALEDALVFITDGLSEMEDVDQNMYSAARLLKDLTEVPGSSACTIAEHLVACVFAHADVAPQFDDVTVLALRRVAGA